MCPFWHKNVVNPLIAPLAPWLYACRTSRCSGDFVGMDKATVCFQVAQKSIPSNLNLYPYHLCKPTFPQIELHQSSMTMDASTNYNPIVRSKEKLVCHTSRIRTLNLSDDGSFLLSAAGNEVVVWNLKLGIHQAINPSNGPVLAITWVPIAADVNGAFAFGCRDSLIHLYRRTGKRSLFVCSASVHLEDGAVEHLIFNQNLLCLVGTAVTFGWAHMWRVNEEGQLTLFPQPEDEPAFPDGLPKQAYHYGNGDHILIKPSTEFGAIVVNRWAPRAPTLLDFIHPTFLAQKIHDLAGLVFAIAKLIFAVMIVLALFTLNIYILILYQSSLLYESPLRSD